MDRVQQRIDELDAWLSITVRHPEWFRDHLRVQRMIERRIAILERVQLAEMRNSRLAGRLLHGNSNVITPIVPAWQGGGKGAGA